MSLWGRRIRRCFAVLLAAVALAATMSLAVACGKSVTVAKEPCLMRLTTSQVRAMDMFKQKEGGEYNRLLKLVVQSPIGACTITRESEMERGKTEKDLEREYVSWGDHEKVIAARAREGVKSGKIVSTVDKAVADTFVYVEGNRARYPLSEQRLGGERRTVVSDLKVETDTPRPTNYAPFMANVA